MGQFDLGFDTGKRLWFVQGAGPTRHMLSTIFVKDSNIDLDHVMIDCYAWAEPTNYKVSHGRLRFYDGNKIKTEGDTGVMDKMSITGVPHEFNFMEILGKEVVIKYNLPSMDWELDIDGTKLISKDIIGLVTGSLSREKLRLVLKDVRLLYSNMVTLVNPQLDIKKTDDSLKDKKV